ncbi:membrane protein [Streptomyces sp. F-3]|uniref:VanZ family protein n=1 Tax=Streptomyces thermogriseus TaxID=75292 RepID=A0ABP4DJV7_9ACTN|nr:MULTISPECIES: VanZ family protein [Streptomyces]MDN5381753.1 VanZ family protein [Streptomyces sp. LB8]GAT81972.1 membrane protein [Streptomyces sp. F-3]
MQRQGSNGDSVAIQVRVAGGALLVTHLALVAWLTLRPLDVPWVTPPNLCPLATIRAHLALGWPEAARHIGEGLAPLAPLGVLLPMVHGRLRVSWVASLLRTMAAGALVSLGIALLQTGVPGRVVDVDVLLLNTAGVALAHLAVVPAVRARLRRRAERRRDRSPAVSLEDTPQGRMATVPRVGIAPWTDVLPPSAP